MDKTQLAERYLEASDHNRCSELWMQSNIMDHLWHYDITSADFWQEVKILRPLYDDGDHTHDDRIL